MLAMNMGTAGVLGIEVGLVEVLEGLGVGGELQ